MGIVDIKSFVLSFAMSEPAVNGISQLIPFLQRLNFTSVQNVMMKEGTYTPNNDYLYLWKEIPAGNAPNFIFLQTNGLLALTITSASLQMVNCAPVNKMFNLLLPPSNLYAIDNIYIEGRALTPMPMVTGVPVDYFCLMAQATF